jgi:hypothetical protein
MKTPDNGSLFILHKALKLMKRKLEKKGEEKNEDWNVRAESHRAIHNFPPSCFKQPLEHPAVRAYVVQFLQTGF